MSAGCILFLFWSITHLTRKLVCSDYDQMTTAKLDYHRRKRFGGRVGLYF